MFTPESYTIAAEWFPRFLGLIYFFAFGAFLFQIRGLIGENGILPLGEYLNRLRFYYPKRRYRIAPTLFWLNSGNRSLMGLTAAGTLFSLFLFLGILPPLMLFLLYILYLSIVSSGQDFLSFGWEGYLLEITANAFLLSMSVIPNPMVWVSINLLLCRFHVQAGAVKLQSRDVNWRNLTAVAYHYQSQPLPNTVAWYFYKLPMWFHKLSCLFMYACELVIPFGIFLGEDVRLGVFAALFALQYFIWATGNFSFLNHLTAVFCVILLNDATLTKIFGITSVVAGPSPLWLEVFLTIFGGILFGLQIVRIWYHFAPIRYFEKILNTVAFLHLANRYGIFAVMTTKRYEIVIEGSHDGLEWKEYTFKYKPSEITRRPKRVSPYQPRIDWQAWFLPFSDFESESWFKKLLFHILKGTPDVLKLLRGNPFPEKPPKYIRAIAYDYVFSSHEEKKSKGWWWRRTYVGLYSPAMMLSVKQEE